MHGIRSSTYPPHGHVHNATYETPPCGLKISYQAVGRSFSSCGCRWTDSPCSWTAVWQFLWAVRLFSGMRMTRRERVRFRADEAGAPRGLSGWGFAPLGCESNDGPAGVDDVEVKDVLDAGIYGVGAEAHEPVVELHDEGSGGQEQVNKVPACGSHSDGVSSDALMVVP
jgi:hypothetical protein